MVKDNDLYAPKRKEIYTFRGKKYATVTDLFWDNATFFEKFTMFTKFFSSDDNACLIYAYLWWEDMEWQEEEYQNAKEIERNKKNTRKSKGQ